MEKETLIIRAREAGFTDDDIDVFLSEGPMELFEKLVGEIEENSRSIHDGKSLLVPLGG